MRKIKRIFLIDLSNLFFTPEWLIYATLFPVILTLALGFLTSGSYSTGFTSYDYYGVSTLFFGITNAATFSANSFMEEKIEKANMRVVYSPINPRYIYVSKIIATTLFCTMTCSISALILHLLVGVNYGKTLVWGPFLIMFFANLLFATIGILVCCIFKSESISNQIISPIISLLCLLGGVFFPISGLGKRIDTIANVSPVTWFFKACVEMIYDQNFRLLTPVILSCIVATILLMICCSKFFKPEVYL